MLRIVQINQSNNDSYEFYIEFNNGIKGNFNFSKILKAGKNANLWRNPYEVSNYKITSLEDFNGNEKFELLEFPKIIGYNQNDHPILDFNRTVGFKINEDFINKYMVT